MSAISQMPRWDLTPFFPSFDSKQFTDAIEDVRSGLASLEKAMTAAEASSADPKASFEILAKQMNDLRDKSRVIQAYLSAIVTTDSFNDAAKAKDSEFDKLSTGLTKINTRFTAWIGKLDVEALIKSSDIAEAHAFYLRRNKMIAQHLMSPDEESLAADL